MKKMIAVLVMVLVFAMTGMTSMAAETKQYEDYQIVRDGILGDIDECKEDDEIIVYSVEVKEFPTERVCIITSRMINIEDGANFRLFYYINGESDEVIATVYDSNGEMAEHEVMTLEEAADIYR